MIIINNNKKILLMLIHLIAKNSPPNDWQFRLIKRINSLNLLLQENDKI